MRRITRLIGTALRRAWAAIVEPEPVEEADPAEAIRELLEGSPYPEDFEKVVAILERLMERSDRDERLLELLLEEVEPNLVEFSASPGGEGSSAGRMQDP